MMWYLEEGSARVTEEVKPAEGTEAPVEPAAPEPAPGNDSAPVPDDPKALVEALKAEIGTNLSTTEKRLLAEVEKAAEAARRAQSASDKNAARLTAQFERRLASFEKLVTDGMSEEQLRVWRAESENARLKAERETVDAETRAQEERDEFGRWSGRVLADEKIDKNDPVFMAAWDKYAPEAKTPAEWRDALWRSVAAYQRSQAEKRVEDERKRAQDAIEQERRKATNAKRESAAPVDTAVGGSGTHSDGPPPGEGPEFIAWLDEQKRKRRERQQQAIMGGRMA